MSDSEEEPQTQIAEKRGRPAGKTDSTRRLRRTAQEISDDKVRIAQMKLDTLKEGEERKLANKKTRRKPAQTTAQPAAVTESELSKPTRDESPSPPPQRNKKQALFDSWFPSSPRGRY